MIHNIIAHEPFSNEPALYIKIEAFDEEAKNDIKTAVKAACKDFLSMSIADTIRRNRNCLNWGDLVLSVPVAACKKHGFRIIDSTIVDNIVDINENLCE